MAVFATCACLMPCAADSGAYNVVDIFNVRAGTWSTAALSQARYGPAATSLPDAGVAIFAGGYCTSWDCLYGVLRDGYGCEGGCVSEGDVAVFATCACLMHCAADNRSSNVVDIFNVRAGTWSTAALSQARYNLAATSLSDAGVAIFAGGWSTFCDCLYGVLRDGYGCEWDA
jgi:hypothetical protein